MQQLTGPGGIALQKNIDTWLYSASEAIFRPNMSSAHAGSVHVL